jgi:hypothetical protein
VDGQTAVDRKKRTRRVTVRSTVERVVPKRDSVDASNGALALACRWHEAIDALSEDVLHLLGLK